MKTFSPSENDTPTKMVQKFIGVSGDHKYHSVAKEMATPAAYSFDPPDELVESVREVDDIHRFRAKECYRNALFLSLHLKSAFVFGYVVVERFPMPITHAWTFSPVHSVGLDPTVSIGQPRDFPEMNHEIDRDYVEIARFLPDRAEEVVMNDNPFTDMAFYQAIAKAYDTDDGGSGGIIFPQKLTDHDD